MNWKVIGAAILGGGVTSLALYSLARWSSSRDRGDEPLAVLARRYRYWEMAGVAIVMIAIALSWAALVWLTRHVPATDAQTAYRLTPHPLYWLALAFFLGNLAATGPTHLLYSWLLGERFAEFRSYQARKFGFDSVRWLAPFYVVFGSACALLTIMALDWYALFSPQGIVIDDFATLIERRYAYTDVLEIRTSNRIGHADGSTEERWVVTLHFADERRWSSQRDPSNSDPQRWKEITAYVAQQTGLPTLELETLSDSEL